MVMNNAQELTNSKLPNINSNFSERKVSMTSFPRELELNEDN